MSDYEQGTQSRFSRSQIMVAVGVIIALIVAGSLWWIFTRAGTTKITAYFDQSIGIYEGSDVRVLGVAVGSVESVVPEGDIVRVELKVNRGIDIPADARAAQVTPSVVSDRYIQLVPAYAGGPTMDSGAVIPRERTATPVEVDQLYESIAKLSDALGPNGANENGALTTFVESGAANLEGNGDALGSSITNLSDAARTLSDSRTDLFGTVENLQVFVTALAQNDQEVRKFNNELADISGFLSSERENLGAALADLAVALGDVARFVADNRDIVVKTAEDLVPVTQVLADNRTSLVNSLTLLPLAVSNLANSYNAEAGTLDSRVIFNDLQEPGGLLCRLMDLSNLMPGDPEFERLGQQLRPAVDACNAAMHASNERLSSPDLILPFGILSAENIQRYPVPGTVPGVESPRMGSQIDESIYAPGIYGGGE